MSLKTYDRHYTNGTLVGAKASDVREPMPWPFIVIGGCPDPGCDVIKPGDWVAHQTYGGVGMVVAINDEQLSVLWSEEPRGGFSNIAFPLVRRVYTPLIANQIVSVQPMSLPKGLIFYMDYTYGDKWDKRCTTGPLPVRVFWRACRWVKTRITSTGSSLRSWWRSRSGKRLSSGAEARVFGPKLTESPVAPDVTKAIVDQWVNRNAERAQSRSTVPTTDPKSNPR